jgi:hypothetical protein
LVVVQQGELLTWLGRPEEGIDWIRKAMRLNPHHPERFWSHLGRAYFFQYKIAFLKQQQLGGAMFWEIGGDREGGLIELVAAGLLGGSH